jgi:hypothetical protein
LERKDLAKKTALASDEKTIIATSTTHICGRFRMDGPRPELQSSKFILLDALAGGLSQKKIAVRGR